MSGGKSPKHEGVRDLHMRQGWQKNSRQITNDNNPRGHLGDERVAEKVAESFPLSSWAINAKGAGEGSCTHK